MPHTRIIFLVAWIVCLGRPGISQELQRIPAFTGFAIPTENSNEEGDSELFSEKAGLHNWTNPEQKIQYFFYLAKAGNLELSIRTKNAIAGNLLRVSCNNKVFTVVIPAAKTFTRIRIGNITFNEPGFYSATLKAYMKKGRNIADIESLEFSGNTASGLQFNKKPRRNSASVHLLYPVADTAKLIAFYNEVTVPPGADPLNSYFMACGFSRGYFGIQVNGPTERRVIFSIWDAGHEPVDRNKVALENRVSLVAKGEGVVATDFGNEGTGGHSHWLYKWQAGKTYRFLVTAAPDSSHTTTIYAGYFFIPEIQKWKLIACFKAPKDGSWLHGLYSFVEDFDGANGQEFRKAGFGNQWVRSENSGWKELTESRFSCDATGRAGDRKDLGGGTDSAGFYLWNGAFLKADASYGEKFTRPALNQKPLIDFNRNADSAVQAARDEELIRKSIESGKLEITGSAGGVYYKILKEGQGEQVVLNDTLVVKYKGSLLSNGQIFDETREDPAIFPLNRLIKGWQSGMIFCKKGGSIRLIIPSAMAYSIRSLDVIPPNSVLVFDIDLVDIRKPAQSLQSK